MITTVSIGDTPTLILPSDNSREELIIQNTSGADVFLNFDGTSSTLTTSNGFKLSDGDAVSLAITRDNKGQSGMVMNAIYGVAAVANKTVRVIAQ